MTRAGVLALALAAAAPRPPAVAQTVSNEYLLPRIEALQHRVDELEGQQKASRAARARPSAGAAATALRMRAPAKLASPVSGIRDREQAAAAPGGTLAVTAVQTETSVLVPGHIAGLLPPEPMGTQVEDALRSDLPGLSIQIPGTDSEVCLYGFAKLTGYRDFDASNQTDGPAASTIPLVNSTNARQGGDLGITARQSRLGVDTRTLTGWARWGPAWRAISREGRRRPTTRSSDCARLGRS